MSGYDEKKEIDYDVARAIIGDLMAMYSRDIEVEREKSNPDAKRVADMEKEISRLFKEKSALHVDNEAGIKRAIKEYGAILRADYNNNRKTNG